jgi:hypothetical protein
MEKDLDVVKALIMLDEKLEQEKLKLREDACKIAEKQRRIKKLITEQDKQDLQAYEKVCDQWTTKSMEQLSKEVFINEDKLDDHLRRLEAK